MLIESKSSHKSVNLPKPPHKKLLPAGYQFATAIDRENTQQKGRQSPSKTYSLPALSSHHALTVTFETTKLKPPVQPSPKGRTKLPPNPYPSGENNSPLPKEFLKQKAQK